MKSHLLRSLCGCLHIVMLQHTVCNLCKYCTHGDLLMHFRARRLLFCFLDAHNMTPMSPTPTPLPIPPISLLRAGYFSGTSLLYRLTRWIVGRTNKTAFKFPLFSHRNKNNGLPTNCDMGTSRRRKKEPTAQQWIQNHPAHTRMDAHSWQQGL